MPRATREARAGSLPRASRWTEPRRVRHPRRSASPDSVTRWLVSSLDDRDTRMNSRAQRRKTFDDVAELYDRLRPGYPERLVDDVVWLSGVPEHGHIVEIGCGTGQATILFARRGYRMTCLEPGPNLAAIARRNLAGFADVRVEVCTFEDWRHVESDLDLVIAAQSFHLVDPATGLSKAAGLLRAGGAIAIFGNHPVRDDSDVQRCVQEAYARCAPELGQGEDEAPLEDRIDDTALFETVVMARYPWHTVYTADDYAGLMETQSPHRLLPADQRRSLLQAIREAVASHGGSITIDYVTRLHLARRRAAVPRERRA